MLSAHVVYTGHAEPLPVTRSALIAELTGGVVAHSALKLNAEVGGAGVFIVTICSLKALNAGVGVGITAPALAVSIAHTSYTEHISLGDKASGGVLSAAKVNLALRLIIFADHTHGSLGRAHIADGVVYKTTRVLSALYVVYTLYAEALAVTGVFNTTRLSRRYIIV